jgi:hypothetical protein
LIHLLIVSLTGTQSARLHERESVREVLDYIQVEFNRSSLDFLQKSGRRAVCVPVNEQMSK